MIDPKLVIGDLLQHLSESGLPVLARVHGRACGAGLALVASCDLAVASDDARFSPRSEDRHGWPHGTLAAIARVTGSRAALEMVLCGRTADAAQMRARGLLSAVTSRERLDEAVRELGAGVHSYAPTAIARGVSGLRQQSNARHADALLHIADQAMRDTDDEFGNY